MTGQVAELERHRDEGVRQRFEERTREETRCIATAPVEGRPAAGLILIDEWIADAR